MTLTKDRIIESVHNELDIPKTTATAMVEYVLEAMKKSLADGEDVLVSGFGKFSVSRKAERVGRNPATGSKITLEARSVVTFKASPVLRKKLNK